MGPNPGQEIEALAARGRIAGVVQIDQGRVDFVTLEQGQYALRNVGRQCFEPLRLEQEPEGLHHVRLVVGNQDDRGVGHRTCSSPTTQPSLSWMIRFP